MPTSQARIDANRRNAQRSTGPRTPEGKRRSARNAVTHGILTHPFTLWQDEPARTAFDKLYAAFLDELDPVGLLEGLLVERVAIAYWRLRRLARAESLALAGLQVNSQRPTDVAHALPAAPDLELYMRYHVTIERQLHRALGELERLQERRRAAEVEPAPASVSARPPSLRLTPRDRETLQNTDALKGEETWDDLIAEMTAEFEALGIVPPRADPSPWDSVLPNEPNSRSRAGPSPPKGPPAKLHG
jgi:hypothetical protein